MLLSAAGFPRWRARRTLIKSLGTVLPAEPGRVALILRAPDRRFVAAMQSAVQPAALTVVTEGLRGGEALAADGPFDVIIDGTLQQREQLSRFRMGYYLLRPGGRYVVADAAGQPAPGASKLRKYLEAAQAPNGSGPPPEFGPEVQQELVALSSRLGSVITTCGHLVITNEAADALVMLAEPQTNAYLAAHGEVGRVLEVRPGGSPPPPPVLTEGPRPRNVRIDRPIGTCDISLREYRNVTVAPEQLVSDGHVFFADSFRHHQTRPLKHRCLTPLSPTAAALTTPWPAERHSMRGTYLYLDNEVRGHFGHLLTETLSRTWAWPKALELDPDCRVIVATTRKRRAIAEYEYRIYEAAGIPRERIVLVDQPTMIERLISGTPLFSNPHYVSPEIVRTWDEFGDRLAARATTAAWPERIFSSRRLSKRGCRNTEQVEAVFAEFGFDIVYPEDFDLADQIAMFRAAKVVAGFGGSGMFQIAFVKQSKHVITVGHESYRARNEYFMSAIRGHRLDAIICEADHPGSFQSKYCFGEEDEAYTRELLAGLDATA